MQEKIQKKLSVKIYPEIGKDYKHYKGGKYNVISLAKHSEADNVKDVFAKLYAECHTKKVLNLIKELESAFDENLVVYKSIGFGSVHVRPLKMWFDEITHEEYVKHFGHVTRFRLITEKEQKEEK